MTDSLDETCSQLAALGITPFKVWRFRPPRLFDRAFRGGTGDFSMDLALAWAGSLQIEVVSPVSGGSLAAEFLKRGGPGIQHVMVRLQGSAGNSGAVLSGFAPKAQSGAVGVGVRLGPLVLPPPPGALGRRFATRFAFFDARTSLGTILELGKFPFGLSPRVATAIGEPDEVIGPRRPGTRARVTGFGLAVPDVKSAVAGWSSVLPSNGWYPGSEATGVWSASSWTEVEAVRLDLFTSQLAGASASSNSLGFLRVEGVERSVLGPIVANAGVASWSESSGETMSLFDTSSPLGVRIATPEESPS